MRRKRKRKPSHFEVRPPCVRCGHPSPRRNGWILGSTWKLRYRCGNCGKSFVDGSTGEMGRPIDPNSMRQQKLASNWD